MLDPEDCVSKPFARKLANRLKANKLPTRYLAYLSLLGAGPEWRSIRANVVLPLVKQQRVVYVTALLLLHVATTTAACCCLLLLLRPPRYYCYYYYYYYS